MIRILLDCFGGDHSPSANVGGALLALEQFPDLSLILSGDEALIEKELAGKSYDRERISILHAPEVVGCDEKPTDAIRLKRESSMMKAIKMLREDDEVAGLVSIIKCGAWL